MKTLIQKLRIYGPKIFLNYVFAELNNRLISRKIRNSYSQRGEDLVIDKLLGNKKGGFYVDIGAYDPFRFSNTYRFYKRGWRGINIEPDFENYKKFLIHRKKDINLNIGIGKGSKLIFYRFMPDTLSTFSKSEADNYKKQGYKLIETRNVDVKKLSDVLRKYSKKRRLDFFTVDTEGYDLEVLKTNDWKTFRPKIICVESFEHHKEGNEHKEYDYIEPYLVKVGYKKVFENGLNSIYQSV